MSTPRLSLRGFLAHAKGVLQQATKSKQKITLVLGNESADLDSMSSSILYAYVRSMSPPKTAFAPLYIPVTNIPVQDVQLRPEFLAVFKHANIEPDHLITLDDLPCLNEIEQKIAPEDTRWILVDHNAFQGRLGTIYASRVAGVIDHHDEEHKVQQDTGDEPRIIEKTGSCTSLVASYCRASWETISEFALSSGAGHAQGDKTIDDAGVVKRWDAELAQLALASILIDTANLQDASKTTEHDREAVEYLEAKIMLCGQLATRFDRGEFYKKINAAKKDIGGLQLQDILRKDYKQWDQGGLILGISSVVKPIDFLQEKADAESHRGASNDAFVDVLRVFARQRNVDLYTIMTTSTSGEGTFQRELLLWAFSDKAVSAAKRFATESQEELGLEDWQGSSSVNCGEAGDGEWRTVWWQRRVQHSRKRVAPLLRNTMQ